MVMVATIFGGFASVFFVLARHYVRNRARAAKVRDESAD
jgi:uncharacterized protein involved in exopolysaccharide biosynthesis